MQCEAFETRLNQLLDRRERPEVDDYLLAHAQRCEACRELLAVQELLFDGLELLERPEVSGRFAQRVVTSAASSRRSSARSAPRWLVVAASLAAIAIVAVFAGPRLFSRGDSKVAGPTKPAKSSSGLRGASALVSPGRVPGKGEKRFDQKTAPTAPGASELAHQDYRRMLEQFPNRLPEVQRDALESVEQIPGGLKPIATSFGVAVGLIRNTLPRGKDESPPPKPQAAYPVGPADGFGPLTGVAV